MEKKRQLSRSFAETRFRTRRLEIDVALDDKHIAAQRVSPARRLDFVGVHAHVALDFGRLRRPVVVIFEEAFRAGLRHLCRHVHTHAQRAVARPAAGLDASRLFDLLERRRVGVVVQMFGGVGVGADLSSKCHYI